MFVTLVDNLGGLESVASEIQAIGSKSPMLQPAWLREWWQFYGQPDAGGAAPNLMLLMVRNGTGALVGIAPFHLNGNREIRFLGTGRVCSDHLTIVCSRELAAAVTQSIADWLFDAARGRSLWQAIDLEAIDRDDATMQAFTATLRQRSDALVTSRPDTGSWCLELPTTWDEYLDRLSKGRRKRCRRWQRTLFDTGRAVLTIYDTPDRLEEGFDTLERLHNRRRRDLGEPGVFEDPTFRAFHRSVANHLAKAGSLRLCCLELDGQPIAAEYCLLGGDTVYAYQSGIEPAALDFSPGHLSVVAHLRWAVENGFRKFDFMRGDESYKSNWGALPRPAVRLRAWQRNVTGRLQQLVETARQNSKPVVSKLKSLVD